MSASLESLMRDPMTLSDDLDRRSPIIELVFFALVGGSGAVAFVLISNFAIALGTPMPDWVVSSLTYAALILPVYAMHRKLSFQSEAPHRSALPKYIAVQVTGLCLASVFSYVFYAMFGLHSAFASVLVIGLTSGVNFFVLRLWAFATK
jgi:putative flippase GtrA